VLKVNPLKTVNTIFLDSIGRLPNLLCLDVADMGWGGRMPSVPFSSSLIELRLGYTFAQAEVLIKTFENSFETLQKLSCQTTSFDKTTSFKTFVSKFEKIHLLLGKVTMEELKVIPPCVKILSISNDVKGFDEEEEVFHLSKTLKYASLDFVKVDQGKGRVDSNSILSGFVRAIRNGEAESLKGIMFRFNPQWRISNELKNLCDERKVQVLFGNLEKGKYLDPLWNDWVREEFGYFTKTT
jgi:hypothetical protein